MAAKTFNDNRIQEELWLEWKAYSRPYSKNVLSLVGTPLVVTVLVGILLLIAMEWMLIVMLSALVFVYYAFSVVPPETVQYKITSRGIWVSDKLYEWSYMTRWWVDNKWQNKVLMVESQQSVMGFLTIPLGDMEPHMVEDVMTPVLLFEKPVETGLDKAGAWIENKLPMNNKGE